MNRCPHGLNDLRLAIGRVICVACKLRWDNNDPHLLTTLLRAAQEADKQNTARMDRLERAFGPATGLVPCGVCGEWRDPQNPWEGTNLLGVHYCANCVCHEWERLADVEDDEQLVDGATDQLCRWLMELNVDKGSYISEDLNESPAAKAQRYVLVALLPYAGILHAEIAKLRGEAT